MSEHSIDLKELASVRDGSGHSIFGASGSAMFLNCPGSLIPNLLAPDDSGPDAAYGTVAHAVTEQWLIDGVRPSHLVGQKRFVGDIDSGHLIEIDEDMLWYAEQCVDRCEWELGEHVVEMHVDFSHLTPIPNQGGTLDFAALRKGRVHVYDHKFGKSPDNMVMAEENTQLMLYAIGLWRAPQFAHYGLRDFIIRINQPRLSHFDEWETTAKRLREFEAYARERMALAWQIDAPRTPGIKQCRFCKVRASCAANAKFQEDLMSAVFGDETQTVEQMRGFVRRLNDSVEPFNMETVNPVNLTTLQLATLHGFAGMASAWWSSLETELIRRAADGDMPPGYKFVEGKTRRVFNDHAAAKQRLAELGLKPKNYVKESLISPAQAEDALSKKGYRRAQLKELLQGLVYKPPGRATLVKANDKRPAIVDIASIAFVDESNRETEEEI